MKSFIKNIEEIIGFSFLFFMALLAFANVLSRYLFNYPLAFTEEVEVGLMVWLTVFGAAIGFKRGAHLGVSYFLGKLPEKFRRFFSYFTVFLTVIVFMLLVYFCYLQIVQEMELKIFSEALGIPQWIYTIGIPMGSLFIVFRVIEAAFKKRADG